MRGSYEIFRGLSKLYHNDTVGCARIETFTIEKGNFYASISGIPSGDYVRLFVNGNMFMSNTHMEYRSNCDFMSHAHGDVLIGGLGLGAVVLCIQDDPDIRSITVLEVSQNVIDVVTKQAPFNKKVKIICADAFTWVPEKEVTYDCIYMDIWEFINSDIYQEMKKLKSRYRKFLKKKEQSPDRYIACWAEYEAKNNRRLY